MNQILLGMEFLDAGAIVRVASYLDGITESGQDGPDPEGDPSVSYFDRKASILNLDGIPFRSFCSADASSTAPSGLLKTLTSSSNKASFSSSFGTGNVSVSGSVTIPADFDFDFYTYS